MQTSQSRLKCRKVLGMGESVDGQFHRSKITQLLGQDSMTSWYIASEEYPTGLLWLQRIMCAFFIMIGAISSFFPSKIHSIILSSQYIDELEVTLNSYSDSEHGVLLRHIENVKYIADISTKMFGVLFLTIGVYYAIMLLWNCHRRTLPMSLLINITFSVLISVFLVTSDSPPSPHDSSLEIKILAYVVSPIISVLSILYYNRTSRDHNFNKLKRNTVDYSD